MPRFWTVCLALILAPPASADGKELKPKFGDIGGVFYTEVSENREACRQAIMNKIALCRQNTSFESNTEDRKYPGCLPIFQRQAEACAAHFRRQASKCETHGSARIADFTGFACTVTATVVEEGGEPKRAPGIAPADRLMQARARTNVRSGPSTDHAKVGLLEAGQEVRVTGEAGAWLRIEAPDGGAAFVHGSLLVAPAPQGRDPAAALSPKCAGMSKGGACWQELADRPGCHFWYDYYNPKVSWAWSGACRNGAANGPGTLAATWSGGSAELGGALDGGRMQGRWVIRYADGRVDEGTYLNGKKHGRWIDRYANGRVDEGSYANGRKHGRWVDRYASGNSFEYDYRDGSVDGQPGVYITESGERYPGRWFGNCFLDGEGRLWVWRGNKENCPSG